MLAKRPIGLGELSVLGSQQLSADRAGYYAQLPAAFAQRRWWTEAQIRLPALSASQRKVLARLHSAGPDGFLGGGHGMC